MNYSENTHSEIHPINKFAICFLIAVTFSGYSLFRATTAPHGAELSASLLRFPLQGILISAAFFGVTSIWFAAKYRELEIIHHVAVDEMTDYRAGHEDFSGEKNTDIEVYSEPLREVLNYQKQMAEIASLIAEGDLSATISPESDEDLLSIALSKLIINLRETVSVISSSAKEVSSISSQLNSAGSISDDTAGEIPILRLSRTAQQLREIAEKYSFKGELLKDTEPIQTDFELEFKKAA